MSTPPPQYQNQPPYGQPQQPYGYPQQPQPPAQRPQPGGLGRMLKSAVIVIAVFGALGYWVWDYNTDPNGGKAKKEAEAASHNPSIGDCVKVEDPQGSPVPTVVDCDSPEAEYKMGDLVVAGQQCGSEYDYGIKVTRRGLGHTMCFTKL
ncbi:LppU/SCO3897 family protein [Streptomyces sp. NPDC001135]